MRQIFDGGKQLPLQIFFNVYFLHLQSAFVDGHSTANEDNSQCRPFNHVKRLLPKKASQGILFKLLYNLYNNPPALNVFNLYPNSSAADSF